MNGRSFPNTSSQPARHLRSELRRLEGGYGRNLFHRKEGPELEPDTIDASGRTRVGSRNVVGMHFGFSPYTRTPGQLATLCNEEPAGAPFELEGFSAGSIRSKTTLRAALPVDHSQGFFVSPFSVRRATSHPSTVIGPFPSRHPRIILQQGCKFPAFVRIS